jgi:hypothetical protein
MESSSNTISEFYRLAVIREAELASEERKLVEERNAKQAELSGLDASISLVRAQLVEVRAVRTRYAPREAEAPTDTGKPTVSEAIIRTLQVADDQALDYEELIRRVVAMREAGQLRTEATSDSRKLVASTVGNLLKSGKIDRDGAIICWVPGRHHEPDPPF